MSVICGWVGYTATRENTQGLLDRMITTISDRNAGSPLHLKARSCALALAPTGSVGYMHQDDQVLAAIEGHPYFSDSALGQLAEKQGAGQALAVGYQDHGVEVVRFLKGDFSLAILDHRSNSAILAVDRLGVRPLSFSTSNGNLVFGSSARAVAAHPAVKTTIHHQALFEYLYFHVVPIPMSVYEDIHRIPPGCYARFSKGDTSVHRYWEMEFIDDNRAPFSDLKAEFLHLIEQSLIRAGKRDSVGAFLSGGTDSSTIAGMLGKVTGRSAKTYSIGFDAAGYDEMNYARISSRHFNTDHHEYYVTPEDVVCAVPRIAAAYAEPYGNASAVPTYYCARMAREDGVELLLGGDGGDELFGGNERYATQWLLSLYSDLPRGLRRWVAEPLIYSFPFGEKIWPIRKARRYVEMASLPMPARLQAYNLLTRLGAKNIFTEEFLTSVDPKLPDSQLSAIYDGARAESMLNRMLALDLKITLADNDLPKVNIMCALAGVDVAYPFLDDDVVSFSAKLPSQLKLKRTNLRYFFKESLRDFLPPQTLTKVKHGFGLPFGVWLQTHKALNELANDNLRDLAYRHIIRPDFITDLVERCLPEHPHYYGTMVWLLMMLELWFKNDEHRR